MYGNNFKSRAIFRRGPFLVNLGQLCLIMIGKVSPSREWKTDEEKSYRTNTKNEIKSVNFTRSIIGKKGQQESHKIILHFGCTNNIFADCSIQSAKILLLPSKCEIIFVTL